MWKTVFTTFILIFLAELGDKTQLSTMLLASKTDRIAPVFVGSACALILSSLLGVLAGSILNNYIPPHYIKAGSGVAFIGIGILLLLGKI
ncbi:MAG: TMEM165/GDT1 family protein [Firmicutes bacterium]|nr:TMEM165/GDT1 family protein [Bacillota bacterium]